MLICFYTYAPAQTKQSTQYLKYIDTYKDIAIEQMLKHRIPASITLAQGLLESGGGTSELAVKGNNHFGIKCHDWTGRTMHRDDDARNECFRAYGSVRESFEDHSQFLLRKRYSPLFSLRQNDYKGWAKGLKECGYATSPTYAQSLINIIESYELYKYDSAKAYDKFIAAHTSNGGSTGGHQLMAYNENYYVIARKGDSFKSIANEFDTSYKKIAKYNERDKYDTLHEGDIVYLLKKQKRAPKAFKGKPYTVKSGDSMYSIAQMFGIRVKYLYKMNNLSEDYTLRVGDQLRVY